MNHYPYRYLFPLYQRVTNQWYGMLNKIKFRLLGVKYGHHCIMHGKLRVSLDAEAKALIGDNFCILSGRALNPLSRNLQACIKVNRGGNLKIGNSVGMSSVTIWCHQAITIGNHVNIGANTIILDSDCHSLYYLDRQEINTDIRCKTDKPIVIGDDVLIGTNCIILKGVTIGDRCVVGAGSVVTKSMPVDCIVGGNPAKIIKYINQGK